MSVQGATEPSSEPTHHTTLLRSRSVLPTTIPNSAVAAQWQLCITYFFAFTISTGFFETQRTLYTVGISLLVVNIIIILIALVVGFYKNREKVANEATIFKLRRQLAVEKGVDKAKFDAAWESLEQADPPATVRVLAAAAQLEKAR